jgi:hypothetical protein
MLSGVKKDSQTGNLKSKERGGLTMKSFKAFSIVVMLLTIVAILSAHEITMTDNFNPLFSIWLPNEWKVTLNPEDFDAVAPDGLIYCVVWDVEDVETDQQAEEIIREQVAEVLEDIEYYPDTDLELDGMDATIIEGSATENSKEVVFVITMFRHADDRVGVVAFVSDPKASLLYKGTIIDILSTVTPDAEFKAAKAKEAREEAKEKESQ